MISDRIHRILDAVIARFEATQEHDKIARYVLSIIREEKDRDFNPEMVPVWLIVLDKIPLAAVSSKSSLVD